MRKTLLSLLLLGLFLQAGQAQTPFDHSRWQDLLDRHVRYIDGGVASQVDYAGMEADGEILEAYLESLSAVSKDDFLAWSQAEQLAFLINGYNAWTVELILTEFPRIDSIRDIGSLFRSPWSRRFISLFGEQVSLDTIEHELIRGQNGYGEPRIHFAVNCASVGCPALSKSVYLAVTLDSQLEEATRLFLSDRSRNSLDDGVLRVSEIFDWYEEDFQQGWRGTSSVAEFLVRYADALGLNESQASALLSGEMRIRHLNYDWSLNGIAQ